MDDATTRRKRLAAAGFVPLPLEGKRPVLKGWQHRTETSDGDLDIWAKLYPQAANTGVLTRTVPTLDIDIKDDAAAAAVEALARDRFEEAGSILVRFGNAPKRAIPFRTETPFAKITANVIAPDGSTDQKIEMLCDGQQVVVSGIHPGTGKAYQWYGGEPGEIKYADLPYIHAEQARALVNDAVDLLVRDHGYMLPAKAQAAAQAGNGFDQSDWHDLLEAIHNGRDLHDNTTMLAAKLIAANMDAGAAVNLLRDMLQASNAPRGERFAERLDDIPRLVSDAAGKFRQPDTTERVALAFAADTAMPDWDATEPPPRAWAVHERIPLRQPTLFSGEGAAGKTILELQLCVATVLGVDWLGAVTEPGPAIYLGAEDDLDEIRRRLGAIVAHYQTSFTALHAAGLRLGCYAGQDMRLAVPNRRGQIEPTYLFEQLLEAARDLKPKHIGIDTSADAFGGNEIDRVQVRQFIGLLRQLAIAGNSSVVLLSHPSLTGINSGSGISGSTAWHNSVRARMFLQATQSADGAPIDSDLRELAFKKNNYGPITATLTLRYRDGLFLPERGGSMLEKIAKEARIDDVFLDVLRKFTEQHRPLSPNLRAGNCAPTIIAEHPDGKAYTRKDYTAALERLLAAGKIHVATHGSPSRSWQSLMPGPAPETT